MIFHPNSEFRNKQNLMLNKAIKISISTQHPHNLNKKYFSTLNLHTCVHKYDQQHKLEHKKVCKTHITTRTSAIYDPII